MVNTIILLYKVKDGQIGLHLQLQVNLIMQVKVVHLQLNNLIIQHVKLLVKEHVQEDVTHFQNFIQADVDVINQVLTIQGLLYKLQTGHKMEIVLQNGMTQQFQEQHVIYGLQQTTHLQDLQYHGQDHLQQHQQNKYQQ